jgi:hypothetical protein
MGGKQPDPPSAPPPAPTSSETSAQAIQAQIDALPKILAAQQQYGGQFSEEQLKSLQTYGPQFAEAALKLQKEYGPQFAEVERSLSPELAGAQKTLAEFLNQSDDQEYNALRPGLLDDVRAGQSQRGLGAISPLGAIDESVQLVRLKQSLKDRRLNVALSTAGRVPIGQMPTVQGQTGTGQLVQNVDPQSIFGYQAQLNNFNSSIFNTQSNIFGTQSQAATARRGQNMDFMSDIIGGGASAYGSYAGLAAACWVAAEVFNEPMDGVNVCNARKFILTEAPLWFRENYIRYGKMIANFIHNKPILKMILKPLFVWFAKKGEK